MYYLFFCVVDFIVVQLIPGAHVQVIYLFIQHKMFAYPTIFCVSFASSLHMHVFRTYRLAGKSKWLSKE